MDRQSFLKHAAVYGLATLLVQAAGFVLLPVYLSCLSPAEYGVLEVLGRLAETVGTVLLFGGFRQALLTFYQQAEGESERRRVVSSTLVLVGGSCLAGGAVALALGPALGGWLGQLVSREGTLAPGLLGLAVLGVLLEPFSLIPLAILQARVQSTAYVLAVLAQFLVRVTLAIVLVRFLAWGVYGALLASTLTGALFGAGLCARELAGGLGLPSWAQMRGLVRFALPLLPGGLCFFVLHHGDRFFLAHFCAPGEVGTYALGYKLAMTVALFSLNPLYMVWGARMYGVARTPEAPDVFGRAFTRILGAYLFVGLGACLFAGDVIALMGGSAYSGATRVLPPVVLGCFCQAASSLMDAGLYVRRRTSLKLGTTLAATAVMLLLYRALIPPYGGMGAALATLGGFALLAGSTWWVTQRVFPVRYEWGRLGALLALSAALWLLSCGLPGGGWGLAGKAAFWLLAPALAWWGGLVSAGEKRLARDLLARGLARLGRRPAPAGPPRPLPEVMDPDRRSPVEVTRMSSSYLGGIWKRGPGARRRAAAPPPEKVGEDWGWVGDGVELFLRGAPACCRVFAWDALVLLLRGYARPAGSSAALDLERVAEELRCHYLEHGTLAVEGLDGSFTVALLDGQAGRVLLYRNLVGTGFTYYHAGPDGLLFGGNLAELVDAVGAAPRPNEDALPTFFLYRWVTGRDTLFRGFHRLLPGEQVCWDARGLRRVQRHTFAGLRAGELVREGAVERVESVMAAVLADCAAVDPSASNLLSGGVDSSYIQALWNRGFPGGEALPVSFSVCVDHPHTWMDTDYAVTASGALGTRHVLVPADGPYSAYLLDTLAATGEPPNHVQSAYFGHLARAMSAYGVRAGLCGEGADSLFGLGLADDLHKASFLRTLLPSAPLRRLAGTLASALGRRYLRDACRLADFLHDLADPRHPVNRVASFTDWSAVQECFGAEGVDAGAARRRELLGLLDVGDGVLDRLHGAGFLGEAVDSAALWATLFNRAGADLLCPFLDSRLLRVALSLDPSVRYPYRRPKGLLKSALARVAPAELATRAKLGFGQPIFEWLAPGGQLRGLVEGIASYPFVGRAALARARAKPSWFLYSLLSYDLWHKLFIARSLPRPARPAPARGGVPTLSPTL